MDLLAVALFLGLVVLFAIASMEGAGQAFRTRPLGVDHQLCHSDRDIRPRAAPDQLGDGARGDRAPQTFVCWWELVRLILEPTSFARVKGDH
jgi:hypothetical protein